MKDNTNIPTLLQKLNHYVSKTPQKAVFSYLSSSTNFGGNLERQLTYQQLDQHTDQLAYELLQKGLVPGDR